MLAATAGAALLVSGGGQAALLLSDLPLATWLTGALLLILSPLLLAAGTVSLRNLGEIHHAVVPTYVNLTLTVVSAGVLVSSGSALSFLGGLSSHVWVLLLIMSTLLIGIQITFQQALQRSTASSLQVFFFLPLLLQFVGDWLLLGEPMSFSQFLGLLMIGGVLTQSISRYFVEQR